MWKNVEILMMMMIFVPNISRSPTGSEACRYCERNVKLQSIRLLLGDKTPVSMEKGKK